MLGEAAIAGAPAGEVVWKCCFENGDAYPEINNFGRDGDWAGTFRPLGPLPRSTVSSQEEEPGYPRNVYDSSRLDSYLELDRRVTKVDYNLRAPASSTILRW